MYGVLLIYLYHKTCWFWCWTCNIRTWSASRSTWGRILLRLWLHNMISKHCYLFWAELQSFCLSNFEHACCNLPMRWINFWHSYDNNKNQQWDACGGVKRVSRSLCMSKGSGTSFSLVEDELHPISECWLLGKANSRNLKQPNWMWAYMFHRRSSHKLA